MSVLGFYRKWIKGECRHFCFKCEFKRECLEALACEEKAKAYAEEANRSKLPDDFYTHTTDRFNNIK